MNEYRVYRLDKDGHIFAPPYGFTSASDTTAIETASRMIDGEDLELWQQSRLVARLPARQESGGVRRPGGR
jgi:hypothetical protein